MEETGRTNARACIALPVGTAADPVPHLQVLLHQRVNYKQEQIDDASTCKKLPYKTGRLGRCPMRTMTSGA
jgi:hypothetical protein